jgi:hypothetical protein
MNKNGYQLKHSDQKQIQAYQYYSPISKHKLYDSKFDFQKKLLE